jgi:hypothetical protein
MKSIKILTVLVLALWLFAGPVQPAGAEPMGTAFTYQGRLLDANQTADGLYDLQFKLYDSPADGNQMGGTLDANEVDVIDGYFTVFLDFGSDPNIFNGDARWLDIGVRPGELEDPNAYTVLSPRQGITPTPYAIYAAGDGGIGADSDWIISGNNMYSGVSGNVGIGTTSPAAKLEVNGGISAGSITASSSITASTITATGSITAGDISATTVYKIGGVTVLSSPGGANTFVGLQAGAVNTGYNNTFSGTAAGYSNTTGYNNTFSGRNAGYSNTTGSYNTFSGRNAGYSNTTGSDNTFTGCEAGWLNTAGSENTFSGEMAGHQNTTGNYNTFSGTAAGYNNTTGSYNTFSGYQAGLNNTTANYNTFSGYQAGFSNTTANYNTFSGTEAGYSNTTGYCNTFLGRKAGYYNTTGNYNTFSGTEAGYSNTTGSDNTFSGFWGGRSNTTGYDNTFSGYNAGYSNTTGHSNTFLGNKAGFSNTTGSDNTFSGYWAGYYNTGNQNTFLGYEAGISNTTGSGNIFLGYKAGYNVSGSNMLYIANSDGGPLIYGDFANGWVGINTTFPNAYTLYVNGAAYATGGWQSSDLRFKQNIETIDSPIDKVMNIKGVSFEWKRSEYKDKGFPEGRHYGVIAQEVEKILPEIVRESPDGEKAVSYTELVPVLTEAIKEQQKQIESLRSEVKALKEAMQQNRLTSAKEVQQ